MKNNSYIKSSSVCAEEIFDLVTPMANSAAAALRKAGLVKVDRDLTVTLQAWMTIRRQVYYIITIECDRETEIFSAEGYSIPVRDADMVDWAEAAENGMWTTVASIVGEDTADRVTGIDLVRWMRAESR